VELSNTVALTAILFMVVLVLTSGNTVGADRSQEPVAKPNEASFERSRTNEAARPAGTEYAPPKRAKRAKQAAASPAPAAAVCQFKPVMTEADMRACRR
jgi:hypothetical protein